MARERTPLTCRVCSYHVLFFFYRFRMEIASKAGFTQNWSRTPHCFRAKVFRYENQCEICICMFRWLFFTVPVSNSKQKQRYDRTLRRRKHAYSGSDRSINFIRFLHGICVDFMRIQCRKRKENACFPRWSPHVDQPFRLVSARNPCSRLGSRSCFFLGEIARAEIFTSESMLFLNIETASNSASKTAVWTQPYRVRHSSAILGCFRMPQYRSVPSGIP